MKTKFKADVGINFSKENICQKMGNQDEDELANEAAPRGKWRRDATAIEPCVCIRIRHMYEEGKIVSLLHATSPQSPGEHHTVQYAVHRHIRKPRAISYPRRGNPPCTGYGSNNLSIRRQPHRLHKEENCLGEKDSPVYPGTVGNEK